MWREAPPRRIFAYTAPTDMRKLFHGLLALVQQVFRDEDPYAGSLFVFVNRRGSFLKAIAWDRTGFVLYAKRLERGRFVFPDDVGGEREALVDASRDELIEQVLTARARLAEAEAQLRWFKQQLFGAKSERRVLADPSEQLALGEALVQRGEPPEAGTPVRAHVRRPQPQKDEDEDPWLRFDEWVPVQRIVVDDPALEGLVEGVDYTVVAEKKSYRLAQQPASYTVLEIVRPVVKRAATGALSAPAALPSVLPRSYADVSLLAGMLVDKFRYHLPLYRQHQRLLAAGITVSRAALTGWVHRTGELLEPIYEAQLASILQSQVIAMDETPIRAGRKEGKPGKMKTGYFWPLYGDQGEVAFPFAPTRAHAQVEALLGERHRAADRLRRVGEPDVRHRRRRLPALRVRGRPLRRGHGASPVRGAGL